MVLAAGTHGMTALVPILAVDRECSRARSLPFQYIVKCRHWLWRRLQCRRCVNDGWSPRVGWPLGMVDAFDSTNKVSTDNAETIQLWSSSLLRFTGRRHVVSYGMFPMTSADNQERQWFSEHRTHGKALGLYVLLEI